VRGSLVNFAQHVGANVVANLVAAAIIYLVGVIVGVFPKSQAAVYSAASFVGIAICFGLSILIPVMQSRGVDVKVIKLLGLASGILAGSTGIVLSVTSPAGLWTKAAVAAVSIPVLFFTGHTFFLVARENHSGR
jgi:hypothetical protein